MAKIKMMKKKITRINFSGVVTALVTPFKKGRVDIASLKKVVRYQLDRGIQGFVVNGTTAESPTLSPREVESLVYAVKKESDNTVPLILGTGSNSTEETIKKTKWVQKLKADAALVVVPYYNKPPQRGLVAHYQAVAKSTKSPVLLYNVPGRTVVSVDAEAVAKLAKIKNIVGIKEATGKLELLRQIQQRARRPDFLLTSGDDGSCIDFMLAGGQGVISVISHIIPKELRQLSDRARAGDQRVVTEYQKYFNLNKCLGLDANPIPVKMALYLMGLIASPELRLPLVELEKDNKKTMEKCLAELDL